MSDKIIDRKDDVLDKDLTDGLSEGVENEVNSLDDHSTDIITETTESAKVEVKEEANRSEKDESGISEAFGDDENMGKESISEPEDTNEKADDTADETEVIGNSGDETEAIGNSGDETEATTNSVSETLTDAGSSGETAGVSDTAAKTAEAGAEAAASTAGPTETVDAGAKDEAIAEEEKKKKRKKIFMIAGGIAAAIAAIYCIIALSYKTKFITGTVINGIDASGMTADQYEEALKDKVESYVLTMKFRNKVTEKIRGKDIGYTFVSDDGAAKLLSAQNIFAWARGYFGASEELSVNEGCSFDEAKMTELAEALPELQFENMEVPTNAHLGVDEKASDDEELKFEIVPETYGTQLIPSEFSKAVIEAAKSGIQDYDVDKAGLYVEPTIFQDDPYLKDSIGGFNEFLSTSVTYDLPNGQKEVLDASVLKNWIAMREDGVQYLNEDIVREHVEAYVALLAMNVDDVHDDRILHSTLQGDVSFSSDTWGHRIDQEAEKTELLSNIQNHNVVEREPEYSLNRSYAENFGGTYVEVDIENQTCFYYEDGELRWSSECVTGTGANPDRRTVRGIFTILNKQQGRTLRGPQLEDGSYSYESYVNYWMQFYEGYGLHDATWRSSYEFGGDTYWYSGSHGCVNLPYYAAESLYFMVSKGTYVLVF